MSQHNADVIVHIDESLDEPSILALEENIFEYIGVVRVSHNPSRPHLLMVDYDAEIAQASMVLNRVQGQGVHAQLVGL